MYSASSHSLPLPSLLLSSLPIPSLPSPSSQLPSSVDAMATHGNAALALAPRESEAHAGTGAPHQSSSVTAIQQRHVSRQNSLQSADDSLSFAYARLFSFLFFNAFFFFFFCILNYCCFSYSPLPPSLSIVAFFPRPFSFHNI